MDPSHAHYAGHWFPAEIISRTVWLYFRFTLSFRDIEELMASRGVILTYESIRQWCLKFGQVFANEIRRRQPKRGDKWPLDEVYLLEEAYPTRLGGVLPRIYATSNLSVDQVAGLINLFSKDIFSIFHQVD